MVSANWSNNLEDSEFGMENSINGNQQQSNDNYRPIGRCVSGADCDRANQCSVMGMQRFAEPRCEALGAIGSPCRMDAEPENRTLAFPHATLECEDVYLQFCPCARGLICTDGECKSRRSRFGKRRPRVQGWSSPMLRSWGAQSNGWN